jgi:hypothetical protein
VKAVDVIENEREEDEDDDEGQSCGHEIVDCQLSIADLICARAEETLTNRQLAIGN